MATIKSASDQRRVDDWAGIVWSYLFWYFFDVIQSMIVLSEGNSLRRPAGVLDGRCPVASSAPAAPSVRSAAGRGDRHSPLAVFAGRLRLAPNVWPDVLAERRLHHIRIKGGGIEWVSEALLRLVDRLLCVRFRFRRPAAGRGGNGVWETPHKPIYCG